MNERRGRDLLVEFVLRMRCAQPAPDLGRISIEIQNPVGVSTQQTLQPAFQQERLGTVPTVPLRMVRSSLSMKDPETSQSLA